MHTVPKRRRTFSWKGLLGALAAGLVLHRFMFFFALPVLGPVTLKMKGAAADCPWARILTVAKENGEFARLEDSLTSRLSVIARDEKLPIEKIGGLPRQYWIRSQGDKLNGLQLLGYLSAEQAWILEDYSEHSVRRGDIVVDCGAHVGVFTNVALERGASKVIAIEPEPVNAECFRRNFARELAEGRVILVTKGVWNSVSEMTLTLGLSNSGTASMVAEDPGGVGVKVVVPVEPLDKIVADLQVPRVDFIKMDIEGAEREALQGASGTLKRFRPRLMLDTYHLPDDADVLPAVIRGAQPAYQLTCGPCEMHGTGIVPHVTFYR